MQLEQKCAAIRLTSSERDDSHENAHPERAIKLCEQKKRVQCTDFSKRDAEPPVEIVQILEKGWGGRRWTQGKHN